MPTTVDRHTKIFTTLLLCFIAAIPVNNSFEVVAMMRGTLVADSPEGTAWSVALTPVYLKVIKDIYLVLTSALLILTCLKIKRSMRVFSTVPFLVLNAFCCLIVLIAVYSMTFMPINIVLMGVRGYWSVALIYAGAVYWKFSVSKVYRYMLAIFALHCLLQVVQLVTNVGYAVYFERRSPGLFIIPATAGAFALLMHCFAVQFKHRSVKWASFVSLILSNSTTGLLILIVYYLYSYRNKLKPKVLFYPIYAVLIAGVGVVLVANLGTVTGRGGGASSSALQRVVILYTALTNWTNLVFGMGMGVATSQAAISGFPKAVIADNTYIGILYNAGIVPALVMLCFIVLSFRYFDNKLMAFTLIGYSMTTVFLEINPIVQIVFIFLGAGIGRQFSMSVPIYYQRMEKVPIFVSNVIQSSAKSEAFLGNHGHGVLGTLTAEKESGRL
jgi:hypothetical protein